jgi:hypothetical protein
MIGGGGASETEEKLALRSASGSTPLFVGEVGVETMVVNSHVVKVPILIESRQITSDVDRKVNGGCRRSRSQWRVSPRRVDPMKGG